MANLSVSFHTFRFERICHFSCNALNWDGAMEAFIIILYKTIYYMNENIFDKYLGARKNEKAKRYRVLKFLNHFYFAAIQLTFNEYILFSEWIVVISIYQTIWYSTNGTGTYFLRENLQIWPKRNHECSSLCPHCDLIESNFPLLTSRYKLCALNMA